MRIDRSLLNWGVFLIALGGVPLAVQQGWAEADIAADLWRVWPLILVGIGLGLVLRWTPLAWLGGALVAGTFGLIFGAVVAGGTSAINVGCVAPGSGETRTTSESGPASSSAYGLQLELTCGDVDVARGTADEWSVVAQHGTEDPPTIEGGESDLRLGQGEDPVDFFSFTQQARSDWTVELPATAALTVGVTLNAATGTVELGSGPVGEVQATSNFSDIMLNLGSAETPTPASLGLTSNFSSSRLSLPAGTLVGGMTLNFSSLKLCLPADTAARLELESTFSSDDFASSGLSEVGGGWQTDGFVTGGDHIDLSITSTFSSIELERPEVCQ